MEKAIKLKVRKELDSRQQLNVIKLKGSLIAKGYTEIIHIMDQDEEFHINYFDTPPESKNEVLEFINAFIVKENLTDSISTEK
jgi:hypothetical protein